MDKHIWFKAKKYGWGWYPITWQAYMILLLYGLGLFFLTIPLTTAIYPLRYLTIIYLPSITILTGFLIIFCSATGETPHWNWGKKRSSKENS